MKLLLPLLLLIAATSASAVPAADGNSDCAQWCSSNFANPGKDCTSPAAQGKGPCYECGPKKNDPNKQYCNNKCCDTRNDNDHCGKCNNKCDDGRTCNNGKCECPSGMKQCNNKCYDMNKDNNNCGSCGNQCKDGKQCHKGECKKSY